MTSVGSPIADPSGRELAGPDRGPIDQEIFGCLCALQNPGRPNVLSKVLRIYLGDATSLMETLRASIARGDGSRTRSAAHSLRSSSSVVGALGLAQLLGVLESACSDPSGQNAGEMMSDVEREYERVRTALQEQMKRRGL
ncbi:MAG TPA: Hpt domain-containing protein [Dissulfurispiraceae bacterium]|nr:Hpt domain-containing protein [Dissulfurispiraceae bacterium]